MKQLKKMFAAAVICASAIAALAYDYKVTKPAVRPDWSGAEVGRWTLDYETAAQKAVAEGRYRIMLVTGAWWCPYCQALEKKVLGSDEWNDFVAERGFYLSMLDFPYRYEVPEEQLYKSKYPEYGTGWGFQCWLYDDAFLAENALTKEDGLDAIVRFMSEQGKLAEEGADVESFMSWDGAAELTHGKVKFPTLIVYRPDGKEAGRLTPQTILIKSDAETSREYVISQIEEIIATSLEEDCGLCSDKNTDLYSGDETMTYHGWAEDPTGGLAGTVTAKATKRDRKGLVKYSAEIYAGGRKIRFPVVKTDAVENIVFEKGSNRLTLTFGAHGLAGEFVADDGSTAKIQGAIDCYKCSDAKARSYADGVAAGVWSLVMKPIAPSNSLANGFGTLSVQVFANGRAKVMGYLGDGQKVSLSTRVIVGETGVCCVPVYAPLYAKKQGGFSCLVWFKDGKLHHVNNIGEWKSVGKNAFAVQWQPVFVPYAGPGAVSEEMELAFQTELDTVDGFALSESPELDAVTAAGRKWTGTDLSSLNLTFKEKTNELGGRLKFRVAGANGRERKISAKVFGVVIDGQGYITVICPNKASWAAKILACSACSD